MISPFDLPSHGHQSLIISEYKENVTLQNNFTNSSKHYPASVTQIPWVAVTIFAVTTLIFILGLTANSVVLLVACGSKTRRTSYDMFLMNLTVADILTCIFSVPFSVISLLTRGWIFGRFMCHSVVAISVLCYTVSTLTCTAIAVYRYLAIVYPHKISRVKTKHCLLAIVLMWALGLFLAVPLAIFFDLRTEQPIRETGVKLHVCRLSWPHFALEGIHFAMAVMIQYIFPISGLTYCYIRSFLTLKKRASLVIGDQSQSGGKKEQMDLKRVKRTNNILLALVAAYIICWTPLFVGRTALIVGGVTELTQNYFTLIQIITHLIAMSTTIYNPIVYSWMNKNVKERMKKKFSVCFSARHRKSCETTRAGEDSEVSIPRWLRVGKEEKATTDPADVRAKAS